MQSLDNNTQAFLALVRAGLWETEVRLSQFNNIDFSQVLKLAEEQAVVGLVAAGIEHVSDVYVPKDVTLQFVGQALQLEQRNSAMNHFIGVLLNQLKGADIYALLIKGQGVAQCYERPLWRACGDVDLLFDSVNYARAKNVLSPLASSLEEEAIKPMHLGMIIGSWTVELHGSLRSRCLHQMDKVIDEVQKDTFIEGHVRSWCNGDNIVFIPNYDNDVFFVFTHILKHFFHGGIGLRQICDWCRLLWSCRDVLNTITLESRLKTAGIMTEWQAFAGYAVVVLGFPEEYMPFYSLKRKWLRKAKHINRYIMKVGNFGHNRDLAYYRTKPFLVRKTISFWRRTLDAGSIFTIFPLDSIKVWLLMCSGGLKAVIKNYD